jgi:GT2 family glycosyltransferase
MHRIPCTPPHIPPLSVEDTDRPLWSVMIPVYNCAQYLTEALNSVLSQGILVRDMQIEVVDDASTDTDVAALVKSIGNGRVKYFRQQENIGSLRNFETCINRARGKLVHILHGDDKVREGYYAAITQLFQEYPEAGAAFCRHNCINETGQQVYSQPLEMQQKGILSNWLPKIAERQRTQYAAITIRREVFEKLGGFYGITYGEDWEMWTRIARYYPIAYTPAMLADYRKHSSSISENKYLSGQHIKDIAQAIELIQAHLPQRQRKTILLKSKRYYAHHCMKIANQLWRKLHNQHVVETQVQQVLYLNKEPWIYLKIAQVYFKIFLYTLWR